MLAFVKEYGIFGKERCSSNEDFVKIYNFSTYLNLFSNVDCRLIDNALLEAVDQACLQIVWQRHTITFSANAADNHKVQMSPVSYYVFVLSLSTWCITLSQQMMFKHVFVNIFVQNAQWVCPSPDGWDGRKRCNLLHLYKLIRSLNVCTLALVLCNIFRYTIIYYSL